MSPKGGNKFRKSKKTIRDNTIVYPSEESFIVEVVKIYNDTHYYCCDISTKTTMYSARVPGRMVYKRQCIDVKPGSLILVSFRECDSNTTKHLRNVDVIYMYTEDNIQQLRSCNFIENDIEADIDDTIDFSIDDI